jgi:hypothetical protein
MLSVGPRKNMVHQAASNPTAAMRRQRVDIYDVSAAAALATVRHRRQIE